MGEGDATMVGRLPSLPLSVGLCGVPPLSWMIEVLRDPARLDLHEWCLIDTQVRAGTDGYLSQTSVLYGPDGHAYAVSHQTVGVFG